MLPAGDHPAIVFSSPPNQIQIPDSESSPATHGRTVRTSTSPPTKTKMDTKAVGSYVRIHRPMFPSSFLPHLRVLVARRSNDHTICITAGTSPRLPTCLSAPTLSWPATPPNQLNSTPLLAVAQVLSHTRTPHADA